MLSRRHPSDLSQIHHTNHQPFGGSTYYRYCTVQSERFLAIHWYLSTRQELRRRPVDLLSFSSRGKDGSTFLQNQPTNPSTKNQYFSKPIINATKDISSIIMKFSIASIVVLATATQGFSPSLFGVRTTTTHTSQLLATRVDSSELVKEALAASKEFGPASPEARLAWEAVEEVDASDNSEASKPSLDEECLTEGDGSKACMEYSSKLNELEGLVGAQKPVLNNMKKIAEEIKAVKITIPEPSAGGAANANEKLLAALAEAKSVSEAKGPTSPEAKVAWDNVEEIAAAGNANAMGDVLTADECLVEAAQSACEALEELNRVLELAKADGAYTQ